jgi:hypothetical protein
MSEDSWGRNRWRTIAIRMARSSLVLMLVVLSIAVLFAGFGLAANYATWSSTLLGIGGSLVASLVFATLSSSLVDKLLEKEIAEVIDDRLKQHEERLSLRLRERDRAQESNLAKLFTSLTSDSYSSIVRALPDIVPRRIYPATESSDPGYVDHIIRGMRTSSSYVFRGVTARHVAQFLKSARPSHLSCTVLLLDPRREDLLSLYVRERFDLPQDDLLRFSSEIANVREEIRSSIRDLFGVCGLLPVHVGVHQGPVYFRSELFDDEAFLSLYAGTAATAYPWTAVFSKGSFVFQFLRKDAQEIAAIAANGATFTTTSTKADLERFLATLGLTAASAPGT